MRAGGAGTSVGAVQRTSFPRTKSTVKRQRENMNAHLPPSVASGTSRLLSRRDALQLITGAGLVAGACVMPMSALAATTRQPATRPTKAPSSPVPVTSAPAPPALPVTAIDSPLDRYMKKGRVRDRTLRINLTIDSYQTPPQHIRKDRLPDIAVLTFQTAAIVFPVLRSTASSATTIDAVKGIMSFDDRPEDVTPVYNEEYPCGTRLGKWELKDKTGRQASLALDIPMNSWETVFDEASATNFPWPENNIYGKVSASTFEPQMFIDRDQAIVTQTLNQWTAGNDPRKLSPVRLAKFLAGKVAETIQPSGTGHLSARNGMFGGFDLQGAARTLATSRGSEHDIASALCALYRNAGLAARTVIGHDISETKGQRATPFDRNKAGSGPHLKSWVEFCLFDPKANKELWVPVDPVRIRGFSSRMQPLDKPWKFFGSHDELDDAFPISFQYHPPTTVVAHGAVAFWGWLTLPETQIATQWLKFDTISTPHGPSIDRPTEP